MSSRVQVSRFFGFIFCFIIFLQVFFGCYYGNFLNCCCSCNWSYCCCCVLYQFLYFNGKNFRDFSKVYTGEIFDLVAFVKVNSIFGLKKIFFLKRISCKNLTKLLLHKKWSFPLRLCSVNVTKSPHLSLWRAFSHCNYFQRTPILKLIFGTSFRESKLFPSKLLRYLKGRNVRRKNLRGIFIANLPPNRKIKFRENYFNWKLSFFRFIMYVVVTVEQLYSWD